MTETQALQKYSGFELDDAEELDEEMAKGSSNTDWMKLKVGKNIVRFLPALSGEKPFRMVREHQLNINSKFINFACPKAMAKKPCPVCTKADELKRSGNPADHERAKDWFPRKRIYSYVIDRAEPDVGPKVFAFGKKIWDQVKEIREDEDFGGDFTDPEGGFDIVIKRKGTTKNDTDYRAKATRQSPLGNGAWLEQIQSLNRFGKILTEQEIIEKLGGSSDSGGGGGGTKSGGGTVVDASFDDVDDDDSPF